MRVDVDFETYAGARWHLLVRTLVLLGAPPGHAAELARQALARRRAEWSHQDAFDDLDAALYGTLLELKRHDRSAWWAEPRFDDELWNEIEPELDRLTRAQREWLVLRHVAELPDSHIAEVAAEPSPAFRLGDLTGDRLRDAARQVPVPPVDMERVTTMAGASRRSRRRRAVASSVALLAMAGVAAVLVIVNAGDDGEDRSGQELEPVPRTSAVTASKVPWYADGKLHLHEVVLELPGLRDVVSIDSGAAYTNAQGDLMWVDALGRRTLLASIGQEGTFVASDEDGLLAWLPDDQGSQLVVHDLNAGSDVARVDVQGPGKVIAIDSGSVFFHDERGDLELSLESGEVETTGTSWLLDVEASTRVYQHIVGRIHAVPSVLHSQFNWAGDGAQLSEDGDLVMTRVGDELTLYDVRSGGKVPTDLRRGERALDAEFGPEQTITYVVLDPALSSDLVQIRTCSLGLVYLPSGERAPKCVDEEAGTYRGRDDEFVLAR